MRGLPQLAVFKNILAHIIVLNFFKSGTALVKGTLGRDSSRQVLLTYAGSQQNPYKS